LKLYIAEKPSLGRAIAAALPRPHRKGEGCIYVGNGDCVSWCVGHLLEQAEPADYDPAFKRWQAEHLPIVPARWRLKPRAGSRKQLAVLRQLVKAADHIVHAGDPDREGQLLVDEVIDYLKVPARKRASIQRCLINDLSPAAVTRALSRLRENSEFIPLSTSALARARADWLYGINMTRASTLQGRKAGYGGVLSVGRVQTPVLGLVVRRDADIEHFVPKPFYQVIAHLRSQANEPFLARWQPSASCQPWQDEEGRVLHQALAENVATRIHGAGARVTASSRKPGRQPPPLPYNLSSLQIDAARQFGMTAKQVLDTCQALYERHKLLTYPRSDCRYLPKEQRSDATAVLAAVASNVPTFATAIAQADTGLHSKAWNDSKVGAHHAIIPTVTEINSDKLGTAERNVYGLVARQYLAQFYPPHEYCESRIDLDIAGGHFVAKARESLSPGWRQLYPKKKRDPAAAGDGVEQSRQQAPDSRLNSRLPALQKNDSCTCERAELIASETTAPRAFDDASLLAAMTGIARHVQDPEIRKVLRDSDGLGTEATRAGIIELLFTRDFLLRKNRKIHATPAGRALIGSLPEVATTPDMTAHWETRLNAISQRKESYAGFMEPLLVSLRQLVAASQRVLPTGLGDSHDRVRPRRKKPGARTKKGIGPGKGAKSLRNGPKARRQSGKGGRSPPGADTGAKTGKT
jgi:DNA topoisomerase-3